MLPLPYDNPFITGEDPSANKPRTGEATSSCLRDDNDDGPSTIISTIVGNNGNEDGAARGCMNVLYACCRDSQKSRTGYVFSLADGPVARSSQSCTANSLAETEYGLYRAGS